MAVFPPEAAREDLLRHLPPEARFTRPSKWHVTLAFLGDIPSGTQAVAEALALVPPHPAFRLSMSGGGRFGTVAWAGLSGERRSLTTLREAVRVALDTAGFAIDPRPFRPHLTVSYHTQPSLDKALETYSGPPWPVTDFALVESTLGNYHPTHTWPLTAPTSPR